MAMVKNTAAKVIKTTEVAVETTPKKLPLKAASVDLQVLDTPVTTTELVSTLRRKQLAAMVCAKVKASGKAIPPALAELAVQCVDDAIEQALIDGDEVQLTIGKFYTGHSEARMGRNPQTGADMPIPAKVQAKFKPSAGLKRALNKGLLDEEESADAEEATA